MPANPKHLSSTGQRILKITAGILGGFIVTVLFHNAIGSLLKVKGALIITSAFSSFILWASLMVIAFLVKNGWKTWSIYLSLSLILGTIIFLNK